MLYLQLSISGLINGALYALLALGIVMIYRTSRVLNLAHGAVATLATYAYWELTVGRGAPLLLGWFATLLLAGSLGASLGRFAGPRLTVASQLARVIASLGLLLFVVTLVSIVWGPETKRTESGFPLGTFRVGDLFVSWEQVAVLVITAALAFGLFVLVQLTRLGLQIRAVSYSTPLSQLMGVRITRVTSVAWALGFVLAAVAGILLTPVVYLAPLTLTLFLTKALAAALFGRLESLGMALVGGLVIGVGEALVPVWFPQPGVSDVFNFAVIVGLLLLRAPQMVERDIAAATI